MYCKKCGRTEWNKAVVHHDISVKTGNKGSVKMLLKWTLKKCWEERDTLLNTEVNIYSSSENQTSNQTVRIFIFKSIHLFSYKKKVLFQSQKFNSEFKY